MRGRGLFVCDPPATMATRQALLRPRFLLLASHDGRLPGLGSPLMDRRGTAGGAVLQRKRTMSFISGFLDSNTTMFDVLLIRDVKKLIFVLFFLKKG